jgi:hypothetical protein
VRGICRQRYKTRQPFIRVGQKARLAHLSICNDIETDLSLLTYDLGNSLGNTCREVRRIDSLAAEAGTEQGRDTLWTGEATDVCGEDTVGAGLHPRSLHI